MALLSFWLFSVFLMLILLMVRCARHPDPELAFQMALTNKEAPLLFITAPVTVSLLTVAFALITLNWIILILCDQEKASIFLSSIREAFNK